VSAAALPTDPAIFAELCAHLLDEASGGSLLLSNVEDMPAIVQDSLIETLARLQSTRDAFTAVRLIAGTTALLHDCIADGTFSERLFYRLNIIHIVLAGRSAARDTANVAVAGKRRVARSLVKGDHIREAYPLPGAATPRRVGRASQECV
jgi:transcriptional regulator of acetoin/glycerol metabolism